MGCCFHTSDTTLLEQKCGQKPRYTKLALMNSIGSCTKKLWLKNSKKKCPLSCHAKSKFIRLWTCTNTQIQRTPKTSLVLPCMLFRSRVWAKETQPESWEKPVLLTLWNQFETEDDIGQHLANTVAAGNIILSMRTRVTTFNGLSLSTKTGTCLMINPPILAADRLKQWYTENKANVAKLVEEGVYRDTNKLFPYPLASEIVTVQRALSSIKYTKTCWVAGKLKYLGDNKSLWTATCNNCRKIYNVPPNMPVKCRSCREDTLVEARCRLPIAIEDETGNIHAMLYDSDAERVIPFNGTDLYQAEQQGVDLTAQIAAAMREHHVVCFIKHCESTHHIVLKLYTIVGMQTDKNLLPPTELGKEGSASASNKITDKELFSPTLKNVLNSLTPPREKPTAIAASESTVKKRISFDSHQSSTSGTSIPSTNIPESPTQQTHQTSAMCDASPTKKSRPKMD
ncbi:replication protein A 70 kDa DNA-binding subunit [Striga asiatica]|uniref:Replication protein A 70 kDa DNA-binding subunit n=1 Tax=Striga asiatica TaxID=4170 RepID=A0A5A7PIP2_STRAF|nr:replication protein A 70 kDa DNA-binding subunit [Striga asiatica]